MNNLPQSSAERAMEGYAQRITARLNEATTQLDYHVVERLRAGRVQALAHRKRAMSAPKPVPVLTRLGSSLAWGGGARRGDIKSPLLVGGGRAFGPKPRDYGFKVNKKTKALARNNLLIKSYFSFCQVKIKMYICRLEI